MTWDVIVVGAGSAGAATALQTARHGLATLLVDKHGFAEAGARWVNGVHGRAFDEAGVERPRAPELRAAGHRFHLVAGWGPYALTFDDTGVLDVDMRLLIERLRAEAARAGAELRERCAVTAIRPGTATTARGVERARVIVDATGLGGLFRSEKPRRADVCAAAQGVYAVRDRQLAEAFFARFEATPGETVCFTSVAGGYSIVSARLEGDELSVLTGSLPALGHPPGRSLRDEFVSRHDWIGELRFGGHAPIPLHRPHRRLTFLEGAHAVVRLGDAAGQVYAAHGSGIGAQLVAARMLAERIARAGASGAHAWERAWHRRFGPAFFAADAFRRVSMRLGPEALGFAMRRGLMPKSLVRLGFTAGL